MTRERPHPNEGVRGWLADLILPRIRPPERSLSAVAAKLLPDRHNSVVRVLVVEDNRDGARLMARLLEGRGHQTQVANDGHAALDLARTERPDVILLDIGLPGMDGYQVAEQLRCMEGMERTLILALTGYGQEADRHRSQGAGIDLHLGSHPRRAV